MEWIVEWVIKERGKRAVWKEVDDTPIGWTVSVRRGYGRQGEVNDEDENW